MSTPITLQNVLHCFMCTLLHIWQWNYKRVVWARGVSKRHAGSKEQILYGRARLEPGGKRWRTGGEVKGKLANGVGSHYSHATSECDLSNITQADAHTLAASGRMNWCPHRFKWTRPFRGKTKSGFCACAITFRMSYIIQYLETCGIITRW